MLSGGVTVLEPESTVVVAATVGRGGVLVEVVDVA